MKQYTIHIKTRGFLPHVGAWLLTGLLFCLPAKAQDLDSIVNAATQYATDNRIGALKTTYRDHKEEMPNYVRLYCEAAITHHDKAYERMLECIDTLRIWYPKQISSKTNLSLAELKAEGLRQLGRYDELATFCSQEIKHFQRKRLKDSSLYTLQNYLKKAKRMQGESARAQLLQLNDLNKIYELSKIYPKLKDRVGPFERTWSDYTLAQAFHDTEKVIRCGHILVEQFADSLDTETLAQCMLTVSQTLAIHCQWKALQEWIERAQRIGAASEAVLAPYQRLIHRFSNYPQPKIILPDNGCSIATTYEWPLLLPVQINGSKPLLFNLNTEQPYTLISEKMARQLQLSVEPDTLQVAFEGQTIAVSPAIVEDLRLGAVQYHNILTLIVHEAYQPITFFDCTLGLHELISLGKIELLPEKIRIFPKATLAAQSKEPEVKHPQLYLNNLGSLRLLGKWNEKIRTFRLTPNSPRNVLDYSCHESIPTDSPNILLDLGEQKIQMRNPILTEDCPNQYCGILGLPFFRNYDSVVLDFNAMLLRVGNFIPYKPTRLNFCHTTDKLYLRRNFYALTAGNLLDTSEEQFLKMLLAMGNNQPQAVVQLVHQLRDSKSDFYDAYTELEALFLSGQYHDAQTLGEHLLQKETDNTQSKEAVKRLTTLCGLYAQYPPTQLSNSGSSATLTCDNHQTAEVKVNGKTVKTRFDIFQPNTYISEQQAKKLKVKDLGDYDGKTYGLIPAIDCNGITIQQVHCIILSKKSPLLRLLPGKGKGILLGWDNLRHLAGLSISRHALTLDAQPLASRYGGAPLCYNHGWQIETEAEGTFPTFELTNMGYNYGAQNSLRIDNLLLPEKDWTPKELSKTAVTRTAGIISAAYLMKKTGKLTFDFQKMRLYLGSRH